MGLKVKQAIETSNKLIPLGMKTAFSGVVPIARDNYAEIVGIRRSRKFFYQETDTSEYKPTVGQRFANLYYSFAFANSRSGDLIEEEVKRWFALRRSFANGNICLRPDFWELEETVSCQFTQLRRAFRTGELMKARFLLVQIRSHTELMLEACETQMLGLK
jgi:hypothetical protein